MLGDPPWLLSVAFVAHHDVATASSFPLIKVQVDYTKFRLNWKHCYLVIYLFLTRYAVNVIDSYLIHPTSTAGMP